MKKKIFITGAVREFDSKHPETFCEGIENYIKNHIINKESANRVKVTATETNPKELTIKFLFGTSDPIDEGNVSAEMYRCFLGVRKYFVPRYCNMIGLNFGNDYQLAVQYAEDEIIDVHKKNTKYYLADRYKSMSIKETGTGLVVKFQF